MFTSSLNDMKIVKDNRCRVLHGYTYIESRQACVIKPHIASARRGLEAPAVFDLKRSSAEPHWISDLYLPPVPAHGLFNRPALYMDNGI